MEKLNACGIYNLEHLLFHLPHRYQNKTSFGQLNQARIGDEILVQLTIERIEAPPSSTRTKTYCQSMGKLDLRFFPVKCFVLWRLIDIQGDTFPNHLCR
jgi:ATP-dependent DNA helicase RecG